MYLKGKEVPIINVKEPLKILQKGSSQIGDPQRYDREECEALEAEEKKK